MQEVDEEFYDRADEHINLANQQLSSETGRGKVSYSLARFNAWVSACGWHTSNEMAAARQETINYFVAEYRKMLEENLDDYIENFDSYKQSDT
ncbi:MAG: DUF3144 domain-containing protein [Pseudomonadales bacterium]|nr:DUF3144 domain-containing protein [Pseudomonadales bacterium]